MFVIYAYSCSSLNSFANSDQIKVPYPPKTLRRGPKEGMYRSHFCPPQDPYNGRPSHHFGKFMVTISHKGLSLQYLHSEEIGMDVIVQKYSGLRIIMLSLNRGAGRKTVTRKSTLLLIDNPKHTWSSEDGPGISLLFLWGSPPTQSWRKSRKSLPFCPSCS